MSVASAMRSGSYHARWLVRRGWSWLTLQPGTRPRRAARRMAEEAIEFVLERPRLARGAHGVLRFTPTLKGHLYNIRRRSLIAGDLTRHGREIRAMFVRAERRRARRAG